MYIYVSLFRRSMTSYARSESRDAVSSSASIIEGLLYNALAIAALCRSPPERSARYL